MTPATVRIQPGVDDSSAGALTMSASGKGRGGAATQ
jgi:hypothetical protein